MDGVHRIVVTGANKGIGLALVNQILTTHPNTYIFLGSRNEERGKQALSTIPQEHQSRVEVLELDVSRDDSVQKAAEVIKSKFEKEKNPLYALVNNAGIGFHANSSMEEVINTNVYGISRTADAFNALLDPVEGRIVNVTSAAGPNLVAKCSEERKKFFLNKTSTPITFPILSEFITNTILPISEPEGREQRFEEKGLGDGSPYHVSKALANLLTIEQAIRFPNLCVNACTPGFILTDLTKGYLEKSGKTAEELGMKSTDCGTVSCMHLLFKNVKERGCYFGSDAKRSPFDKYRSPGAPEYTGED